MIIPPDICYAKDSVEGARKTILLCRLFRKDAVRRNDWNAEIFAERKLNEARKRYVAEKAAHPPLR